MRYFNAVQAARELDISDKTIRRYIEKGKIVALRKESGELAISEEEVDRLRLELDLERSYQKYRQSLDIPVDTILDLSRQIEELTARLVQVESRLVQLESRQGPTLSYHPMPVEESIAEAVPDDLTEGTLPALKFAEQIGITREVFEGVLRHGLGPDHIQLEHTKIRSGKNRYKHYFTPEEQKNAIPLLRRYGKLPEPGE